MEWGWIDWDKATLTVPVGTRGVKVRVVKQGTSPDYVTPLPDAVMNILKQAKEWVAKNRPGCRYVFPSPQSTCKPLSDAAFGVALRRLGYTRDEIVAHGFRSIFSTVANREGKDWVAVEVQLGHNIGSEVSRSYNRNTSYLERRRELLEWWSGWLQEVGNGVGNG
jgi:integrase